MAVKVKIPVPLERLTEDKAEVEAEGKSIRDLINNLEKKFPGIRKGLCDKAGKIRHFINIYVNGEDIRFLQKEDTPIKDGDEIFIISAIAGG